MQSLHVNTTSMTFPQWCRFQPEDMVILHDAQPHSDYWPTKVESHPLLPMTGLLLSVMSLRQSLACICTCPTPWNLHIMCARSPAYQCRKISGMLFSGLSGTPADRTPLSLLSRAMAAWMCRTVRSGMASFLLTMKGYLPAITLRKGLQSHLI